MKTVDIGPRKIYTRYSLKSKHAKSSIRLTFCSCSIATINTLSLSLSLAFLDGEESQKKEAVVFTEKNIKTNGKHQKKKKKKNHMRFYVNGKNKYFTTNNNKKSHIIFPECMIKNST